MSIEAALMIAMGLALCGYCIGKGIKDLADAIRKPWGEDK